MNIKKIHYDVCDSTNTRAKEYLRQNDVDRLIVTADMQTGGRGRQGKSFYSPDKTGVYMTYCFKAALPICSAVAVTTYAAAAVCRALEKVCKRDFSIKWVNDIYKDGKKVCGILAENIIDATTGETKHIIIGVGINLSTKYFPDDIKDTAASIDFDDKQKIIDAIIKQLGLMAKSPLDRSFMDYYRARSIVLGKEIICIRDEKEQKAYVIEIDNDGGLLVQYTNGTKEILNSGEISLKLND